MKNTVLMLLLAAMSTGAMAEWVRISSDIDLTLYADPATIRRSGDTAKMWSLIHFNSPQHFEGFPPYLSSKSQDEFDCKKERSRDLRFSWHSGNMGDGKIVFSNSDPHKWGSLPPGSANEALWKVACGKLKLK